MNMNFVNHLFWSTHVVLTGYTTEGSYSVLLPDGRIMTVTYSVPDTETGFLAEVSYEVDLSRILLKIEREFLLTYNSSKMQHFYVLLSILNHTRIPKNMNKKEVSK